MIEAEKFLYTHEDIIMPIIMSSTSEAIKFRSKLGYKKHDITLSKEQSVESKIKKLFSNESILLQHSVLGYKIHLYFPEQKLAIEVNEKGHTDRVKRKKNRKASSSRKKTRL